MSEMKTLGLVGGISWVSTLEYYRLLNEAVNRRLGGLHSPRLIICSLDFDEFVANNSAGRWDRTLTLMRDACQSLVAAGADGIMLCANTAHAVIEPLKAEFSLPFIDIVEETARAIERSDARRVALLGTKFTMELPFFREGLACRGIEAVTPAAQDTRDYIQTTLRDELGCGIVRADTRLRYLQIIEAMIAEGCEAVIFGCTEIPLVLSPEQVSVPCFDTLRIHVDAGVRFLVDTDT